MTRVALLAVTAGLIATPLLAADLPARMPVKAPVAAIFNWTGFYGGLNGGYGWGGDTLNVTVAPGGFSGSVGDLDLDGWFAGLQGGYNLQNGSTVFGIEGDFQWANMDDSLTFAAPPALVSLNANAEIDMFATLRGRLGHAQGRTLWYITGGVAFANIDMSASLVTAVGTGAFSSSDWKTGWVAGAGVEHALNESWSIKLEYQYLDFSSVTFNGIERDANQIPIGAIAATFDPSIHTVRLGLNGRFVTGR